LKFDEWKERADLYRTNPERLQLLCVEGKYGIWYLEDDETKPSVDNAWFAVWALEQSPSDVKFRDLIAVAAEQAAGHRA